MKKVLIFTPRISGQRANYYNSLSKLCKLTVLSELDTPKNVFKNYGIENLYFNHIVIGGIKIRVNSYEALCFNYKNIFKNNYYDKIIIEQVFTPTALLIMKFLKKIGVGFFASADGGIVNKNENKLKYKIKKSIINLPNYWLTSGQGGYAYLNNYGIDNKNIFKFIFSSYNENDLPQNVLNVKEKSYLKNKLKIKEKIVILSAGQPIYRKGHDILLSATKDFNKNVGIYIAGGKPNKICEELINKFDDSSNVHFLGLLDKQKLKEYYSICDMFVFPSRYDIWGYPIQEAMSFGVPIISSDTTIAAIELIENYKNGFIFENENIIDLRNKIDILLNDNSLCELISRNNFIKSKLYTSENMAKTVYNIICKVG